MSSKIRQIHTELTRQEYSCTDLIKNKLSELENSPHNSANSILAKTALQKAQEIDQKIQQGEKLDELAGIPFGVKDVYLLQGTYATASADMLKSYKAPYTATAIQKLLDKGAIPIVRENCDSFGHGSSSENTVFGAVKNALDLQTVAGGSSGGSAVNVAKNYTVFSIGGDTGGSIRQPAGFNQVYGLKPTYGRISRFGLMAYASSTDCVGMFTQNLEDTTILLNAMSGKDFRDQTSIDSPKISEVSTWKNKPSNFTVGFYRNFIENEALDASIRADFINLIEKLQNQGVNVQALDFYDAQTLVATYYIVAMAETASNLARLDGINYGERSDESVLKDGYALTRSQNFTQETKRRVVSGNQVLSQGHSEEIYLQAQSLRNNIMAHFANDFEQVNVILSPVAPNHPPKIGENLKNPLAMYLSDAYTVGFSLGKLPTLTAPFGTDIGVQITTAKNQEETAFQFAQFLETL